jgi:hypothetical protein
MARPGVPKDVERFIATDIDSVEQLEVLLLLRAAPDKQWTAKEVARALVSREDSAAHWLARMTERGLLTQLDNRYRYATGKPELAETIDALAESFAKYRVTVVALIFSKPSERVRLFSDAFRIRRSNG